MPFADLSTGAHLHYLDTETGKQATPVMLVHGMLGTPETQLGTLVTWLAERYRVIAPTLRGYGKSNPKPRRFPQNFYQQDAADVLALIDTLALPPVHLLGYSDGGEVSLLASAMAPERFRSVTVWGAVGYYGPQMRPAAQRMFPATWITDEEKTLHGIEHPDAFVLEWIQTVRRIIDSGGDLSLSRAPDIAVPLLILLGMDDRLNPVEYGQAFIDRTPFGKLQTLPCGHAIHDEAIDEFRKIVGDFLSTHDSSA